MQNNPLYIPRSGYFIGGSFSFQASVGGLWSGTTNSGTNAYLLLYNSSYVFPAGSGNRYFGYPVRRIAPTFFYSSDFGYLLVEQGITSSFGTANQNINWNSNGYSNIQKSPLYTTRSGYFGSGSLGNQATGGYLWSGTTLSGTYAYYLGYDSNNVYPASYSNRQNGFPVRCIAQHFYIIIQKKNQNSLL